MKHKLIVVAIFIFTFLIPLSALAECENLNINRTWTTGINNIVKFNQDKNYDAALEEGVKLYNICPISPTLLYQLGYAVEGKGELNRALIYYQKATENMTQMAVEPGTARLIWYKRYELEHPNRSEQAFMNLNNQLTQKDALILSLERDKTAHIQEIESSKNAQIQELEEKNTELEKKISSFNPVQTYEILTWTGTGTALAGIILFSTGAGLAFGSDSNTELVDDKALIKSQYLAGWALFGTGIALTVVGSALAGYAGYHYSKIKTSNEVVQFHFSPSSASLQFSF